MLAKKALQLLAPITLLFSPGSSDPNQSDSTNGKLKPGQAAHPHKTYGNLHEHKILNKCRLLAALTSPVGWCFAVAVIPSSPVCSPNCRMPIAPAPRTDNPH